MYVVWQSEIQHRHSIPPITTFKGRIVAITRQGTEIGKTDRNEKIRMLDFITHFLGCIALAGLRVHQKLSTPIYTRFIRTQPLYLYPTIINSSRTLRKASSQEESQAIYTVVSLIIFFFDEHLLMFYLFN